MFRRNFYSFRLQYTELSTPKISSYIYSGVLNRWQPSGSPPASSPHRFPPHGNIRGDKVWSNKPGSGLQVTSRTFLLRSVLLRSSRGSATFNKHFSIHKAQSILCQDFILRVKISYLAYLLLPIWHIPLPLFKTAIKSEFITSMRHLN